MSAIRASVRSSVGWLVCGAVLVLAAEPAWRHLISGLAVCLYVSFFGKA